MFDKITKKNWLFYAIKNYNVPNLDSEQEFYEDVKRFKYLKRLFRKYKTTGELKTRLVLNHIIVLTNVLVMRLRLLYYYLRLKENIGLY